MTSVLTFSPLTGKRVHLGVSGSVAAYKSLELLRLYQGTGLEVGVTLTESAKQFVTPLSFSALGASPILESIFPQNGNSIDYDINSHLAPGRIAEVLVIAPATANTIAKLAHGLADDMLSCNALSFPGKIVIAPAMNPKLWNAVATQENAKLLCSRGHLMLTPEQGAMACGDQGQGRLPDLEIIYYHTLRLLCDQDLAGKKILITMGPTREPWDGVRFWSNPSSGKMGLALAISAWLRGADVHCVHGPVGFALPHFLHTYSVETAQQMHDICHSIWTGMDIGCFSAAVCDFRPVTIGTEKFKKSDAGSSMRLEFEKTTDILASISELRATHQKLIGFAAETSNLLQYAQDKLKRKSLDLVVGNLVGGKDSGFQADTNEVIIVSKQGVVAELPVQSKSDIAWRIWDCLSDI